MPVLLWPPCLADEDFIYLPRGVFFLSFYLSNLLSLYLFSSPILSRRRLDVYTWCGLSVNLQCTSETCCTRLAESRPTARKKSPKIRHLRTIAQLCRAITSQLRHISTTKKLLNSNIFPTCPQNMVNFDPLAAEIGSLVWGTPANCNGFRVLARRETRLNQLGCPKLTNRSQPLVGRSSPYCEDMWRRYC